FSVSRVVTVHILFLFFQATDDLVECGLAEFVAFNCLVFFESFNPRLDLVPGISGPDRRIQVLDPGPQCVDGPSLVAVCSMLFFLVSPESLLLDTLEDELQNIRINACSPAI